MDFRVEQDTEGRARCLVVRKRGAELLANPFVNKGTAFSQSERDDLGLNGLLPPAVLSIQQQLQREYERFCAQPTDLEKFIYLTGLRDRNETAFFRLAIEHIDEMMPILYTPEVGEACQRYSHIYERPRGLYISYDMRHDIDRILASHMSSEIKVIVVTDGERILGLGDQGIGGMGIPIGKLCLYTLCAGFPPYATLPITLDVGTNNEERLADPLYLGIRRKRVRGEAYQDFLDAFVAAIKTSFPNAILQWEDLLKANAMRQLHRFRDELCSFNDDIQGTASVQLAGIYSALEITKQALRDQRILIAGAGAAAQGIADLLVTALMGDGLSAGEARGRIWMVDSHGLVTSDRPMLEDFKSIYSRDPVEVSDWSRADPAHITLQEAVEGAGPTVLIGTSGTNGIFSEPVIRGMARINQRPLIFPLSNPTSKSECTPDEAVRWSEGRAIVATGSPFAPVRYGEREHRIGQCNNAFIFPGLGLGLTLSGTRRVGDAMFLTAARALADCVHPSDRAEGALYPKMSRIRECSHAVACAVIRCAVSEGTASQALLDDLEGRVRDAMWYPEYLPVRLEN